MCFRFELNKDININEDEYVVIPIAGLLLGLCEGQRGGSLPGGTNCES